MNKDLELANFVSVRQEWKLTVGLLCCLCLVLGLLIWHWNHPRAPTTRDTVAVPVRNTYSREQETCDAMASLFGKPFVKVRPSFLVNPETNRRLEIDCFNSSLKIGAEFNGIGHYKWPNPFHKTQQQFEAQQRRDVYKLRRCKEEGIRLFVVPDTIKKGQIRAYLASQLSKNEHDSPASTS